MLVRCSACDTLWRGVSQVFKDGPAFIRASDLYGCFDDGVRDGMNFMEGMYSVEYGPVGMDVFIGWDGVSVLSTS